MVQINKKMVQNSLFCAPKGAIIFAMGFLNAFNGLATLPFDRNNGKLKIKQGLYAMYNNFIPLLEMTVIMGGLCLLADYIAKKYPAIPKVYFYSVTPAICLLAMISICLVLRATGLRKDCCGDFDHKSSYDQKDGVLIHFKIPGYTGSQKNGTHERAGESRNSKILKWKYFSFDYWVDKLGLDNVSTGHRKQKFSVKCINFAGRVILAPFFAALLVIQLVELPFRLLIDGACCAYNKIKNPKAEDEDRKLHSMIDSDSHVTLPQPKQRGKEPTVEHIDNILLSIANGPLFFFPRTLVNAEEISQALSRQRVH